MGEITEMQLEGTLCILCGRLMEDMEENDDPPGHPRKCKTCEHDTPKGKEWG